MTKSIVYLIPTVLAEDAYETLPPYVIHAVQQCRIFFVEDERTARRYLKKIWKEMVIDDYSWATIHKAERGQLEKLKQSILKGDNIGIISEAGCPGVADPGQLLIEKAHALGAIVRPLVGPSSILLALMASGLNGQQFQFTGYLPIEPAERIKAIRQLEDESLKKRCTQIFIETPYRNNQLAESIFRHCRNSTRVSIAANLTAANESIRTMTVGDWKKSKFDYHKQPAIFCLLAE